MDFQFVKIVVFVPVSHADHIRTALAESGCGHIGNYDSCSFSVRGTGRFRPLKGANPFIGKAPEAGSSASGNIEYAEEERIETICPAEKLDIVLEAIKQVHPYEVPAVDVYPLLN